MDDLSSSLSQHLRLLYLDLTLFLGKQSEYIYICISTLVWVINIENIVQICTLKFCIEMFNISLKHSLFNNYIWFRRFNVRTILLFIKHWKVL